MDAHAHQDHTVHFYDDEKRLQEAVSSFLHEGFSAGQPLVVIATQKRRRAFSRALTSRGVDVRAAGRSGRLAWRDVHQTLDQFMVARKPDADLFQEHVGGLIASALAKGPSGALRAYGEMVDVLWREGNPEAALRLEELWNELAGRYSFSLFCTYDMANFSRESDAASLLAVCSRHSRILPHNVYVDDRNPEARALALVVLQQRARALDTEIEHRKTLERALRRTLALRRKAEHERERLLAEAEAARSQAEHANRLKDEFLTVVSHELRTPLNAIRGWAQIIAHGRADTSTVRHGIDVIQRNAQVQHELIEELLDVSRIVAGKMPLRTEVVDLSDVVRASIDIVRPSADARTVAIEVEPDSERCLVKGDSIRLQQIVWNLLANAVKFSQPGGRVVVSLKPVNAQAALVVQDEGVGIPSEFLPFVFDRFRQADAAATRAHGGLGLGLTVVRHLVEAHGGTVTAQSDGEGRGATFAVALPLETTRAGRSAPLSEAMGAA